LFPSLFIKNWLFYTLFYEKFNKLYFPNS